MKFPHVTIEYQEDPSFALGKVSLPLIVGFGLHWAWVLLFVMNGQLLFFQDTPSMEFTIMMAWPVCTAVTLLCYGVFFTPMRRLFATTQRRDRIRMGATAAVLLGMALAFAAAGLGDAAQAVLGVLAAVLTGAGGAVLLVSFGVSFSVCDLPAAITCIAVSQPVTAVVYVAVLALDAAAHPAGALVCVCLPVVEYLFLRLSSRQLVDRLEFSEITLPVKIKPFLRHVCLPSFVLGLLVGLLRTDAAAGLGTAGDTGMASAAVVAGGLFSCVILACILLTKRTDDRFMFQTVPPVVAILLALPVLVPTGDALTVFCLVASYFLLAACLWAFFSDVSQRFRVSAFFAYGLGAGSKALGGALTQVCASPGMPLDFTLGGPAVLLAVAFVVVMFGVALLPNDDDLRSTLERGRYCPALVDLTVLTLGEEPTATTVPAPQAAEPQPTAQEHEQQELQELQDEMDTLQKATETEKKRTGRFKKKCIAVADRYLLSRKETEVLFLLAKGHKSATIQETLYISEGTVNTHMRHIYRKLDVHSQRELMNLVEAEVVPEEDFKD